MYGAKQRGQGRSELLVFPAILGLSVVGLMVSEDGSPVLGILVSTFIFAVVLRLVDDRNPIQMLFLVGYGTFLYAPAVLNSIEYGTSFELFYLSSVIAAFFLRFTKGLVHVQQEYAPAGVRRLFAGVSALVVAGAFLIPDLVGSLFPLEIMLFTMALGSRTRAVNLRCLLYFLAALASYSLVAWNGFGRTVVAGWLLVAFLYYCYASGVRASKLLFGLAPTAGSFLLTTRELFSGGFATVEAVLGDSAFGPYRLASTFAAHAQTWGLDLPGFFDQVIFTLFVFVPRDIWPEKPYGFGFEYTVKNLDAYLVAAGHSVAATFIGEHLYYLGYWGLLTAVVMSYTVAALCRLIYGIRVLHGHGIALVACSVPVLVWGGMTSFSARLALPLIVMLAVLPLVTIAASRGPSEGRISARSEHGDDITRMSEEEPRRGMLPYSTEPSGGVQDARPR